MNLLSQLQPRKANAVKQAIARHDAFIEKFVEQLSRRSGADSADRHVSIIARSPASPVVSAVLARAEDLKSCGVTIQVIFAEFGPDGMMADCARTLAGLYTGSDARDSFRWARNICLMDAHEQFILGTDMCWSGDCMRREPGKIDALDLFESDAPKMVRLGTLAFDAIWAISERFPASRLRTAAAKAATTEPREEERLSAFSFLRKSERPGQVAH